MQRSCEIEILEKSICSFLDHPTYKKAKIMQTCTMTGPYGTYTFDDIVYRGLVTVQTLNEDSALVKNCPFFKWLFYYISSNGLWDDIPVAVRVLESADHNVALSLKHKSVCGH